MGEINIEMDNDSCVNQEQDLQEEIATLGVLHGVGGKTFLVYRLTVLWMLIKGLVGLKVTSQERGHLAWAPDRCGQCFQLPRRRSHSETEVAGQCGLVFPTRIYKQSKPLSSNTRKRHLSEWMREKCLFPAGSDLAPKWHLIKQNLAAVCPHSTFLDTSIHPWMKISWGREGNIV